MYDDLVAAVLEAVAVGASVKADIVAAATAPELVAGDPLALARIAREREAATGRLQRDRDVVAWPAAMARLDEEEATARERSMPTLTAAEARAWLEDLPALWRDTDDDGRRMLAAALFDRVEVLGARRATFVPTPKAEAYGFVDAWQGPVSCSIGGYGRGERI